MNFERKPHAVKIPETVVSGSFRKHMEKIGEAIENFEKAGIKVLSPTTKEILDPNEEFVLLATDDPSTPPHRLEMNFMREIRRADFLYVANVDGYVGHSAGTEMAYACLKGLPIIVAEGVKSFSDDIPLEAQQILRKSISDILSASDISQERFKDLKEELVKSERINLNEEEKRILQSLVKSLLKDLKSLSL